MSSFWFWLGIACASLNLGMLNTDLQFLWGLSLWMIAILWRYFAKRRLELISVLLISIGIWSLREYQLNQQRQHVGMAHRQIVCHQADITWKNGYLTGLAQDALGQLIRIHGKCPQPPTGQQFELMADLKYKVIEANRNKFTFNPQQYWRTKGVTLEAEIISISKWTTKSQVDFFGMIKTIHYWCVNWFEDLPPGLRDYGETLLLGHTRSDFYRENSGIQLLGLVHLFSISGFQVAMCHAIWFTGARLCGLYKEDAQYVWFGHLGFIWFFAGSVQSLIRPILASAIGNHLQLKCKKIDAIDIWGLTLVGSLWLEPGVLHQLGGQLSFLLSFGLLWLHEKPFWQTNVILNVLIAPCLITQTYAWQPLGVLANLLLIPIFTYVVVPVVCVGVGASLIGWGWLRDLCEVFIVGTQTIIRVLGTLSGEIVSGQPEIWWIMGATITTGLALVKGTRGWWCLLVGMYSLLIMGTAIPKTGFIDFIDVKQGDATLWRTDNQEICLMDVGGSFETLPTNKKVQRNFVAEQLCQVLRGYGITTIDHLILSHQDIDHIGNFAYLSEHVKIKHVYMPMGMRVTKNYRTYIQPFVSKETHIHDVMAGEQIGHDAGRFLHPFTSGQGRNEDSIVLLGQIHKRRFLLMGDLDKQGEKKLLARFNLGVVDILKCGHHGSKTSTSMALLRAVKPQIAIISSGVNNRFKHPHAEVLTKLQTHRVKTFNTAVQGMISFENERVKTCLEKSG